MGEEVRHFTLDRREDNTYGWPTNEIVKVFLQAGYQDGQKEMELNVRGKKYKVLRREPVTVFYDEDGNTLFDVENSRLKKEYQALINDISNATDQDKGGVAEKSMSGEEDSNESPTFSEAQQTQEDNKSLELRAKEKLKKELAEAKDKTLADPVIKYLMKRREEDTGMAEDVLQTHKTWGNCLIYIYGKARKQSNGKCAAVRDDVVYEWAEDYFRLDDKAEKKEVKRKGQEKKKKVEVEKGKPVSGKQKKKTEDKASAKPKKSAETEKKSEKIPKKKEPEGQMSLFDLL